MLRYFDKRNIGLLSTRNKTTASPHTVMGQIKIILSEMMGRRQKYFVIIPKHKLKLQDIWHLETQDMRLSDPSGLN